MKESPVPHPSPECRFVCQSVGNPERGRDVQCLHQHVGIQLPQQLYRNDTQTVWTGGLKCWYECPKDQWS
jgi:hypothetical protein